MAKALLEGGGRGGRGGRGRSGGSRGRPGSGGRGRGRGRVRGQTKVKDGPGRPESGQTAYRPMGSQLTTEGSAHAGPARPPQSRYLPSRALLLRELLSHCSHCVLQPTEIAADPLSQIAAKHWSAEALASDAKPAFDPELVVRIYNEELGGAGKRPPPLRKVMMLEISQYLESYLWPHFDATTASPQHVLSILLMINEKFRENVPAWSTFSSRPVSKHACMQVPAALGFRVLGSAFRRPSPLPGHALCESFACGRVRHFWLRSRQLGACTCHHELQRGSLSTESRSIEVMKCRRAERVCGGS